MPSSRRTLRIVLLVGLAILASLVGACGYAWWEIRRIVDSNINGKAFMNTGAELKDFVEATGRWPESEEEFLEHPRTFLGRAAMQEEMSRTIIVYDVDLAKEDLDSVKTFRLLKPRNPDRFSDYGVYDWFFPEFLATLRAARDGELPAPAPTGQAVPDDAEEASAGEVDGSREGASVSEGVAK